MYLIRSFTEAAQKCRKIVRACQREKSGECDGSSTRLNFVGDIECSEMCFFDGIHMYRTDGIVFIYFQLIRSDV